MRRQIVLMVVAVTSMLVVAFLVPLGLLVRSTTADAALDDANLVARDAAQGLAGVLDPAEAAVVVSRANARTPATVIAVLPDGTVVGDTTRAPNPDSVSLARQGRAFEQSYSGGIDVYSPVLEADGSVAVVRVTVPDSVLRDGVAATWLVLAMLAAALVAVAALVGDRLARSIVGPLRHTSEVAARLASGHLEARAEVDGTPEVTAVAHALNVLAERIEYLLQAERESVADLSHRLRTPVTALRLDVEALADREAAAVLVRSVDRLEHALSDLITEARAPRTPDDRADLVAVARRRVAFWEVLAQAQGRRVAIEVTAPTLAVGADETELESVLDALLGNFVRYTPPGSSCQVTAGPMPGGRPGARLVVQDDGPGLGSIEVAARGRRGGPARGVQKESAAQSGTGLGLDIVRRVAEASGGSCSVGSSSEGGARVVLELGPPPTSPR